LRLAVAFWAVARLQLHREQLALRFLEQEGFQPYYPTLREWGRRFGRKVETHRPLFVGYCFVMVTLQWSRARWAPGVAHLLMNGAMPARCPDRVIEEIRKREVRGAIEVPKGGLQRGDRIRILAGPFTGRLAIYSGMKPRERVEVLLQVLGAGRRLELARSAVEAV
jgi:transcriptional antiterminator RfaH